MNRRQSGCEWHRVLHSPLVCPYVPAKAEQGNMAQKARKRIYVLRYTYALVSFGLTKVNSGALLEEYTTHTEGIVTPFASTYLTRGQ